MKLPPCKHRFQHVSRIQRTVRFSRADNRMQFIDKKNNLSVAVFNIIQHGLQTFLKLAAIFRTCHKRTHIQRKNLFVF